MFKAAGNFLHKTPWWALTLLGISTLSALALYSTPFHVLRFGEIGKSPEERRAIKREIDSAFGDSALGVAEGVVAAMRERANDPVRKAELEQALEEIAKARQEIFNARREVEKSLGEASSGGTEAAKDAANNALDNARTATERVLEAAREKREQAEEAREEVAKSLESAGLSSSDALKSLDGQIANLKSQEQSAQKALDALNTPRFDDLKFRLDLKDAPAAPAAPIEPADPKAGLIPPPTAPQIPTLPSELRQDIRSKVASDVRRIGIGSVLILVFIPLFFMTLVAKFFIDRSRKANAIAEQQTRVAEMQSANRQLVEARLQALQAQVEPHFLYNTLANVQALTEIDPPQANKMVGHLIQYLRAALPKMREASSTIGQELELVRAYLNILKMRMAERLSFDIVSNAEIDKLPFPPMMLLSLVENAIKHGLEPQREGGRVDVIAERIDDQIRISVKDTGRGLQETAPQSGSGVGLSNIRERLLGLFGDAAKLTLQSNTPNGVIACIDVPLAAATTLAQPGDKPATEKQDVAPAVVPSGFAARTWWMARKTHGAWLRIVTAVFMFVMVFLGVMLVLSFTGLVTGLLPFHLAGTELGGVEGMALGSVALLVAFAAAALAALILTVVVYGLGILFSGLIIGIPIIVLVSVFPVLAPFVLFGLLVWWLVRRKNRKMGVAN